MKKRFPWIRKSLAALLFAAVLPACGSKPQVNLIKSVELGLGQYPALGMALTFHVNGSGSCKGILIDWGDGATETTGSCADNSVASGSGEKLFQCDVTHLYSGWGGGKTVTAMVAKDTRGNQITTCEGRASLRFTVSPSTTAIGFVRPGPNVCDPVPGKPPLANRTLVKIATTPISTRCGGIWYQNENPHCYDAEGGAVALATPATDPASPFPFLGMRKFSLVLRVGNQLVQGGTNMQFTTNESGPLELCVNEPNPRSGSGGYEIQISTDQLGPP